MELLNSTIQSHLVGSFYEIYVVATNLNANADSSPVVPSAARDSSLYSFSLNFDICVCLTLRRLMSYIYMEHPFLMFLDHTQRRSTVGRTPLDE